MFWFIIDTVKIMWYNNNMGLFSWFKNLFKKGISLAEVNEKQLVALVKDNAKIKFGTSIDVKPNFLAVLVYKNKIMDTFAEGRYRLDIPTMPLLSRYQKLTKPNKKGDLPKKFKVDVYFVNLKAFVNFNFDDCIVHIKNKVYKNLNVFVDGNYSFQVTSPIDFLEALFTQYGVVKDSIAKAELTDWVCHLVSKRLEKKQPTVEMLYKMDPSCFDGLLDYVNKDVADCGIKLSGLNITKVKFPKRIYKRISIGQDKLEKEEIPQYTGEMLIMDNQVQKAQQSDFANDMNNVYKDQAEKIEQDMQSKFYVTNSQGIDYADAGNMQAESSDKMSQNISNNNVMQDVSFVDGEIVAKQPETDKEELVVQKVFEYKKCSVCGALNAKDSEICFACKNKI